MINSRLKVWLATIVIVLVSFAPSLGYALTVSPGLLDYSGASGDRDHQILTIGNGDTQPLTVVLEAVTTTFSPDGDIRFSQPNPNDLQQTATWLNFPIKPFTLAIGEAVEVPIEIEIPQRVLPGGYYAAVMVKQIGAIKPNETGALVEGEIAVLLSVDVAGLRDARLFITKFDPERRIIIGDEVSFKLGLKNDGAIHLIPYGPVSISNLISKKAVGKIFVNQGQLRLYPATSKLFEVTWKPDQPWLTIGKFNAQLNIGDIAGQKVAPALANSSFYFISPKAIFLIITLDGMVLTAFILDRKKIKRQ